MPYPRDLKILPVTASRRGRPPIGFGIQVADGLEVELPEVAAEPLVRCAEHAAGRPLGVLEVDVFAASLVVDPVGAIADIAGKTLAALCAGGIARARPPAELELAGGVHGVRLVADLLRDRQGQRPPLPYVTIVVLAGASVRGGVLITARAATDAWAAGEQMIDSVEVLDRDRAAGMGVAMPLARR